MTFAWPPWWMRGTELHSRSSGTRRTPPPPRNRCPTVELFGRLRIHESGSNLSIGRRSRWSLFPGCSGAHRLASQTARLTFSFYSLFYELQVIAQCNYLECRQWACSSTRTHRPLHWAVLPIPIPLNPSPGFRIYYYGSTHSHTPSGKLRSGELPNHLFLAHSRLQGASSTRQIVFLSSSPKYKMCWRVLGQAKCDRHQSGSASCFSSRTTTSPKCS